MTAALALAGHGFPVHLVERQEQLGGTARKLHQTHTGDDIAVQLAGLVDEVEAHELITVHTGTEIDNVTGFIGNFKTSLGRNGLTEEISHGAAIIAAGAAESKPEEYLYGDHPAVFTALEFDGLMKADEQRIDQAKTVAFIQCVGSRDEKRPYCSKVCCTHTMVSALEIKKRNPEAEVVVFYRDIRTYGQREHLYRQARQAGVIFIRYSLDNKPRVEAEGDRIRLTVTEPILGQEATVVADLVCLAAAAESHRDQTLAQFFKVPLDADGWFLEAHQKLRPLDFAADGVFVCGMAHYPKPVDESIAQAPGGGFPGLAGVDKGDDHPKRGGLLDRSGVVLRLPGLRPSLPLRRHKLQWENQNGRGEPGPVQGLRGLRRRLPVGGGHPARLQPSPDLRPDKNRSGGGLI